MCLGTWRGMQDSNLRFSTCEFVWGLLFDEERVNELMLFSL